MKALRLTGPGRALSYDDVPTPEPEAGQVLIEVLACGVCRTDLHVLDGELPDLCYPVTPGHEVVGRVVRAGRGVTDVGIGDRVGVPWLAWTCGECRYCRLGLENLCERALFTGYTAPGGYAEYLAADARYCLAVPKRYSNVEAAPLLCAGLIGYRAYRAAGDAARLGLYGFGAAAHLLAQVARADGREVYAFTKAGDADGQRFARSLGAVWAGGSDELPPEPLDAAIIFAAVGALVPAALAAVRKGGRVVCAGIHMSDIPQFPYSLLWGERSIVSVANLTRADGAAFMRRVAALDLHPAVERFALAEGNEALARLKSGRLQGAAVLVPERVAR
ncbi:MAG TPA: zinc-dependent alcohol dehydrogenase family protein [Gammaproteobacteria bacterium]|jgi:propanol-preferring alcohol dehydrogenase|nr:zinc-dependent alcohol dehydrogenase family protein [Gammaproteobacteria bacterium]